MTNTSSPPGVAVIPVGDSPTSVVEITSISKVSITDTVLEPWLATNTKPSPVAAAPPDAIPIGVSPTSTHSIMSVTFNIHALLEPPLATNATNCPNDEPPETPMGSDRGISPTDIVLTHLIG